MAHVLLVDGKKSIRLALCMFLKRAGYAATGVHARMR